MSSTGAQAEHLLPDVAATDSFNSFTKPQTAEANATPAAGKGATSETRLGHGGRIVTRLVTSGPRDDGYCSSDSTPKGTGEFVIIIKRQ